MTRHVARHPHEMMYASLCLISGGVLERFPGLRVGLLEANCSWVPYWLMPALRRTESLIMRTCAALYRPGPRDDPSIP